MSEPMRLVVRVPGPPVPAERPRVVRNGYKSHSYLPERSRSYQHHIALHVRCELAKAWRAERIEHAASSARRWALVLEVTFGDARRRDLSNVVKQLEDALNGVLWKDDSQIDMLTATRMPIDAENPGVLLTAWVIR